MPYSPHGCPSVGIVAPLHAMERRRLGLRVGCVRRLDIRGPHGKPMSSVCQSTLLLPGFGLCGRTLCQKCERAYFSLRCQSALLQSQGRPQSELLQRPSVFRARPGRLSAFGLARADGVVARVLFS